MNINNVTDGTVCYNKETNEYFLVIGATSSQESLVFEDALDLLEDKGYSQRVIILVQLLDNDYQKAIQYNELLFVKFYMLSHACWKYHVHISIKPYKVDILKRKLLDKPDLKEMSVIDEEEKKQAYSYLCSCCDFLDKLQLFQWIKFSGLEPLYFYFGVNLDERAIAIYNTEKEETSWMSFETFKNTVIFGTKVVKQQEVWLSRHRNAELGLNTKKFRTYLNKKMR